MKQQGIETENGCVEMFESMDALASGFVHIESLVHFEHQAVVGEWSFHCLGIGERRVTPHFVAKVLEIADDAANDAIAWIAEIIVETYANVDFIGFFMILDKWIR